MEFLRHPQLIPDLFNGHEFGPPPDFTLASTWPWVDHPVSGLLHVTFRPIKTRFPFGSVPLVLNLATYNNSPDRSTKSTLSSLNALQLLVNIGFQVLFHSPPGVLFTFPSRYCFTIGHQVVFSLGRWSSLLPTRFHVPRGTLDSGQSQTFSRTGLLPSVVTAFHPLILLRFLNPYASPQPQYILLYIGLGSSAFARHYLRNHCCFLFLWVLRCFSSPRLPPIHYVFMYRYRSFYLRWVPPFGYLRVDGYLRLSAAFRSLSRPSSAPGAKAFTLCS